MNALLTIFEWGLMVTFVLFLVGMALGPLWWDR